MPDAQRSEAVGKSVFQLIFRPGARRGDRKTHVRGSYWRGKDFPADALALYAEPWTYHHLHLILGNYDAIINRVIHNAERGIGRFMPGPFSALIKPASSACNMRCRYCFYADESESRSVANMGMMSYETLENLVRKAFDYAGGPVSFAFQGGEPTLAGLDFYRTLIALEKRYNTKRLPVSNALQTNGLMIDDAWAAFLGENRFLVGLSMDGYAALHDGLRRDAALNGTFSRVRQAADALDRHHVEYNILSVVTSGMARRAGRVYRYLRDSHFRYLQFIPCLDPFSGGRGDWSLTAADYGAFLRETFDGYYDDFMSGRYVSVRQFDNYIMMLRGRPPESCGMSGLCMSCMTIEGDGGVYPCDFYVLDRWKMGNINEDGIPALLNSPAQTAFVDVSRPVQAECRQCEWYPLCRGGCRRHRETPDGSIGANRFCESYRSFFPYAIDRMKKMSLRMGR